MTDAPSPEDTESAASTNPLSLTDSAMARVLEDLITLLTERNIIRFTDLPLAAQKRLNDRASMRKKTQLSGLLDHSSHVV